MDIRTTTAWRRPVRVAAAPLLIPLRHIGLDPGRALRNARPTPDELALARAEQLRFIRRRTTVVAAAR